MRREVEYLANPTLFNDPIIVVNYTENGSNVSKQITNESREIVNNKTLLQGIPLKFPSRPIISFIDNGVKKYMSEIPEGSPPSSMSYTVDYTYGWIFFDSSMNGKTVTVESYYSRGYWLISEQRVWTRFSADGGMLETLEDLTTEIKSYRYLEEYNPNTTYERNNQVILNGTTYMAIKDNFKGIHPSNKDYWRVLAAGSGETKEWSSNTRYYPRDTVYYENSIYLMKDLSIININYSPVNYPNVWTKLLSVQQIYHEWNLIKPKLEGYQFLGVHNQSLSYKQNNQVFYRNTVYIAKKDVPANIEILNTTYWSVFAGGIGPAENWSFSRTYIERDLVTYDKAVYICVKDCPAGVQPANAIYWLELVSVKEIYAQWQGADGTGGLKNEVQTATANANAAAETANTAAGNADTVREQISDEWYGTEETDGIKKEAETVITDWHGSGGYKKQIEDATQDAINATSDTNAALQLLNDWEFQGEWDSSITYKQNNFVFYRGSLFIALQGSTGKDPLTEPAFWKESATGFQFRDVFVDNQSYFERDIVTNTSKTTLYLCKKDSLSQALDNTEYWERIIDVQGVIDSIMALAVPDNSITDTKIGTRTVQDPVEDQGIYINYITGIWNRTTLAIRALRQALNELADNGMIDGGPFIQSTSLLCGTFNAGERLVGDTVPIPEEIQELQTTNPSNDETYWIDHVTPVNAANLNKIEGNISNLKETKATKGNIEVIAEEF